MCIKHIMSYAKFELSPEQKNEKKSQNDENQKYRTNFINNVIATNNLVELKSDYFGMSRFFFDPKRKNILEVHAVGQGVPNFFTPEYNVLIHIKQLNGL